MLEGNQRCFSRSVRGHGPTLFCSLSSQVPTTKDMNSGWARKSKSEVKGLGVVSLESDMLARNPIGKLAYQLGGNAPTPIGRCGPNV